MKFTTILALLLTSTLSFGAPLPSAEPFDLLLAREAAPGCGKYGCEKRDIPAMVKAREPAPEPAVEARDH